MWSIGVIATALLTGDVIFTNRIDPTYETDPAKVILDMAAKCDLSVLDRPYSAWSTVGKRPKDFVRKLLVLDEEERMNVKAALAHKWFTNKLVANEFDAVYHRAVRGWESQHKIFRLVEALDLARLPPEDTNSDPKKRGHTSRSRHFARPSIPNLPVSLAPNSNAFSKRNHTPLPKITEESELDDPFMPYSELQSPDKEHFLEVQSSLGQLAISQDSPASVTGTDILIAEYGVSNRDHVNSSNGFDNLDYSSAPEVPPPHSASSESVSDFDVIPDTPPPNRKRRSSPPSEDIDHVASDHTSYPNDDSKSLDVASPSIKRTKVAS
jgi:pheromone a factor receptor